MELLAKLLARRRRKGRPGATDLLAWGTTIHLAVDWMTQNEWIADHKHRLVHPAGYVHAAAHGAAQWLVFPAPYAAALGVTHLVIDTRQPLRLWTKVISQPEGGAGAVPVQIWRDQTAHVISVAVAALLVDSAN